MAYAVGIDLGTTNSVVSVYRRGVAETLMIKGRSTMPSVISFREEGDVLIGQAAKSRMLIDDPAPLTDRVLNADDLPFSVTLVTNENATTTNVVSKMKPPFSENPGDSKPLGLAWPVGVISLSHVALPISPDDFLYGQRAPNNEDFLFLGQMAIQGERGLLQIPSDWMLRLRYNPFYSFLESRTIAWVDQANTSASR